jgi:hypothetical protein
VKLFGDLLRDYRFAAGFGALCILVFFSVLSLFSPFDPTVWGAVPRDMRPSAEYWLGTDSNGQDIFWQATFAVRNSLIIAVVAGVVSRVIAVIIGMVAGNQERLLRCHDIVRALNENPKALRSELDRAIDFLVRQGVFLEGMEAFEDSFSRLGKAEMLEALKNVKVDATALSEVEQKVCAQHGFTPEEVLEGSDAINELIEAAAHQEGTSSDLARTALNRLPIPIQIKLALTGKHARASEALQSTNKMVAMAGIRNPSINESDASRIARNKSMHEDVIRFICNNGDWTKSYAVKLSLVMNPKCSPRFVMSWMALLRQTDLKTLAKSKQVPSSVQAQAKRLLDQKNRR